MIRILSIKCTCKACPSQWEGYDENGKLVYIRYRWGFLDISYWNESRQIYGKQIGDPLDGTLSYEQLKKYTEQRIQWPEECLEYEPTLYVITIGKGTQEYKGEEAIEKYYKGLK